MHAQQPTHTSFRCVSTDYHTLCTDRGMHRRCGILLVQNLTNILSYRVVRTTREPEKKGDGGAFEDCHEAHMPIHLENQPGSSATEEARRIRTANVPMYGVPRLQGIRRFLLFPRDRQNGRVHPSCTRETRPKQIIHIGYKKY